MAKESNNGGKSSIGNGSKGDRATKKTGTFTKASSTKVSEKTRAEEAQAFRALRSKSATR